MPFIPPQPPGTVGGPGGGFGGVPIPLDLFPTPPVVTNPNPAPLQPRPPMPGEDFATPVNQPVPQTQIPPELLAALMPGMNVTGAIPSPQQQQAALYLMQSGKVLGLNGEQDLGNGMTLTTMGGAPAFNPFARMPAARPFVDNLPPEIQGLFDFAPMSFQSQPFASQDVYPGQQIGNLVSRAENERTRLQSLSNASLGLPKGAKDKDRNQAIVDLLNEWGRSVGWGGNINDELSRFEGNYATDDAVVSLGPTGAPIYGPSGPQLEGPTSPPGTLDPNTLTPQNPATQGRTAEGAPSGSLEDAYRDQLANQADFGLTGLIIGGALAAGGSVAGSAIQANQAKKSAKGMGKIPKVFAGPTGQAATQIEQELLRPGSTYMMPQIAPMSAFEIAGLGQIANQALNPQYQAAPITRAPTLRPLNGGG